MKKTADVGVIVGRFQSPVLHEGHMGIFGQVLNKHRKVLVFLGLAHTRATINNPLDLEARRQMVSSTFPQVSVMYIKDCRDDDIWSRNLDKMIADNLNPGQTPILYGSRDSFIKHYKGRHPTEELVPESYISASKIREDISKAAKNSPDWRTGAIWAAYSRYPATFPTVDVAVYNTRNEILVARKEGEDKLRFIGGFAEPNSNSFEDDAFREVHEEAGITIKDIKYIGSFKIDDWRYRNEQDKIKTLFFAARYSEGDIKANDDVCEVKWVPADSFRMAPEMFMPEHQPLVTALADYHAVEGYRYSLKMD